MAWRTQSARAGPSPSMERPIRLITSAPKDRWGLGAAAVARRPLRS